MEPLALTVPQVAAALNLGVSTVFRMIQRGELQAVTVVGKRRVLRKDLEAWLSRLPKTVEA